jgi:hypothetical protein
MRKLAGDPAMQAELDRLVRLPLDKQKDAMDAMMENLNLQQQKAILDNMVGCEKADQVYAEKLANRTATERRPR